MERDISNDRTSLRRQGSARGADAEATQVRNGSHAMQEARSAHAYEEIEEDVPTRLGPVDADATFLQRDAPTSARMPMARSVPGLRAASPPSAHARAAEARARRERLSASFTSTPSGKMTLRPPPLDLSADQTIDPPARVTRPTRTVASFAPARVSFPPPMFAPPSGPSPLRGVEPASHGQLGITPELRATARRPLAPPILTQLPAYLRSNAPSSVAPVALGIGPASAARARSSERGSRAQTILLAALLVLGVGTTGVMGAATFSPGTLARGRAAAAVRLDTLLGHPPRTAEPPPAPIYVEVLPPVVAVPPVLAEATRDGGP